MLKKSSLAIQKYCFYHFFKAGRVRPWRLFYGTMHPAGNHFLWQAVPHVCDGVLHAYLLEDLQPPQIRVGFYYFI
jgi:hypothetical protein